MNRSDKEIVDLNWINHILNTALYCHIAFCEGEIPYVVPMNFAYHDGKLILHSATEGEKIRILKQNSHVSFSVEDGVRMVTNPSPCGYGMWYRSVSGAGDATVVEDLNEKRLLLKIFTAKFHHGPLPDFSSDTLERVLVIKVTITRVTGKNSGY